MNDTPKSKRGRPRVLTDEERKMRRKEVQKKHDAKKTVLLREARRTIAEDVTKTSLASVITDLVLETSSFSEFIDAFHDNFKNAQNKDKGDAFEWFSKAYFLAYAKMFDIKAYHTRLDGELPDLGVSSKDVGSDAILEHPNGELTLIQIKYRRPGVNLTRDAVVGMAAESKFRPEVKVRDMILFSNVERVPQNLDEKERRALKFVLWGELEESNWNLLKTYLNDNSLQKGKVRKVTLELPELRDWQVRAVEWALNDGPNFGKAQIIACCGSGKTRCMREIMSLKSQDNYFYKKVLVCVPNLHLLSQWFEVLASSDPERSYMLVGTDVGTQDDEIYYPKYHLTTISEEIADFWAKEESLVIISTYQSLDKIMASRAGFDLCVADEAHMCCSASADSNFSLPTKPDFPATNIVYTTATPKVFRTTKKTEDDIKSMDDEKVFGKRFLYSFRQGILDGVINDYKIAVGYGLDEDTTERAIDNFEARFLVQSFEKHGLKNCLAFSSNHAASKRLYESTKRLIEEKGLAIECLHMKNRSTSSDKSKAVTRIENGERLIIFNVRVFSLGSDIRSLESVLLTQGKKSVIQTVQSVSRCLRKQEGKMAKILVPCVIKDKDDLESEGGFKRMRSFLSALGSVDTAIEEEIRSGGKGQRRISFDLVTGGEYNPKEWNDAKVRKAFETQIMDKLGNQTLRAVKKFELLKEYCREHGKLPPHSTIYKEEGIGYVVRHLLGKEPRYPATRETWIQELRGISEEIKDDIDSRLEKKEIAKIPIELSEKFDLVKQYCLEFNKLPGDKKMHEGIDIGTFVTAMLSGEKYKDHREGWIEELKNLSESVQKHVYRRLARQGTMKGQPSTEEKAEMLKTYCMTYGHLPKNDEEYEGQCIGTFMANMFARKIMKKTGLKHIEDLRAISESISSEIDGRLASQGTRKGQPKPEEKFLILKEYCEQFDTLPSQKIVYKGVCIGTFLDGITAGNYKDVREEWIEELLAISPNIDRKLTIKLSKQGIYKNQPSTQEKFDLLVEYCTKFDRLPARKEKYKNTGIGFFLDHLLRGDGYKDTRDEWIDMLCSISDNVADVVRSRVK